MDSRRLDAWRVEIDDVRNYQEEVVTKTKLLADDETEVMHLRITVSTLESMCREAGSSWLDTFLFNVASQASDDNLKWLTYWVVDNHSADYTFGEDFRSIDWPAIKTSFDQTNILGKAILLKSLTPLARNSNHWDELRAMHISVFDGSNDDLKAVALAYGLPSLALRLCRNGRKSR